MLQRVQCFTGIKKLTQFGSAAQRLLASCYGRNPKMNHRGHFIV